MIDPGSGQGHADEAISIRQARPSDREWILGFLRDRWGSDRQVADGQVFYPADHLGFIALVGDEPTGLLTYRIEDRSCEVTLLDSGRKQTGIGSALLRAVEVSARERGCRRIWLVTTDDNLDALRFYQRRGFALTKIRPRAVARSRQLKPEISLIGEFGIPLRDELELETLLD